MKFSAPVASLCSLISVVAVSAASNPAQVFLIDPVASFRPTSQDITVDPHTAQLILARRLRLSHLYDVPVNAPDALLQINRFGGGAQQLLKGNGHDEEHVRALVVVDNVYTPSDLTPSSPRISSFGLNPSPHYSQTEQLLSELRSAALELSTRTNEPMSLDALSPIVELDSSNTLSTEGSRYILHVKSLRKLKQADPEYKRQIKVIRAAFDQFGRTNADISNIGSATVVLMPPEHHCVKRSVDTYEFAGHSARDSAEQPLSGHASHATPSDDEEAASSTSKSAPSSTSTSLLRGPVPSCFSSKSACEQRTGNCTGHGECLVKYKAGSSKSNECWGCTCNKPEVKKNKNGGRKTTNFGGNACQKKDVVMPFWLLGGTTVFIVFIVSSGIGLLYSIGSEELPSVIGAGVTGPRATK